MVFFSLMFRRSGGFSLIFVSKWLFFSWIFRGNCGFSLIFRRSGGFFVDFSSKWWFFRGFFVERHEK